LVYVHNHSYLNEFDLYANKIRTNFVEFLNKNHKIQVKEVKFFLFESQMVQAFKKSIQKIFRSNDKQIGFILLHLPWDVIISESERLKLKVNITVNKNRQPDNKTYQLI
jgi:hypothetical protein